MTDFVRDLDEQLVAAARRRARAGGRGRAARAWRRPWRITPARLGVALSAIAAVALAGVGLAMLGGDTGPERVVGGPPPTAGSGPFTLPSPGTITACPDEALGRPVPSGGAPGDVLSVLRQGRRAADKPPKLRLDDGRMLLPITTYLPEEVRRVDPAVRGGRDDVAAWIVPTAGVRAAHCGEPLGRPAGPGACLVTRRGAFLATRCWTLRDILAGRALTLVAPRSVLVGLVADGVASVEIRRADSQSGVLAAAGRNVVGAAIPRARRGTPLRVALRRQSGPRIAFLNGTTQDSRAAAAERRLRESGYPFRTAVIGDAAIQDTEKSRVYWTGRNERTAIEVGGRLAINDLWGAAPEELRMLAPKADVIVVLGADATAGDGHTPDTQGYAPPPEHKGGGQ